MAESERYKIRAYVGCFDGELIFREHVGEGEVPELGKDIELEKFIGILVPHVVVARQMCLVDDWKKYGGRPIIWTEPK